MEDTNILPLKLANMRSPKERNLCYINAMLQTLRNVPEFRDSLHQLKDHRLVESLMMDIFTYIGTEEIASAANLRFAVENLVEMTICMLEMKKIQWNSWLFCCPS